LVIDCGRTSSHGVARASGIASAAASFLPLSKASIASITNTAFGAFGVEQGMLIQWSNMAGMLPAKDAAATTTVVAANEEAECVGTRLEAAYLGGRVRLRKMYVSR
jgi:hypothetical protein